MSEVILNENIIENANSEDEDTELEVSIQGDESKIQDVEILKSHGIKPEDIEKLKAFGINTIKGIEMTPIKELLSIKGLTIGTIETIKKTCIQYSSEDPFITAAEFSEQRRKIFKLSTGSTNLDNLLNGGIEAMSITEVFGEFSSGKTQLSHTLCVTAQMPGSNGYKGGKVIFIDTENTFRPERLQAIAQRFNLNEITVLENILCTRAFNSEHQFDLLNKVANKLYESHGVFKLLIIDSIIALFRVEFMGPGDLLPRQQKLAKMLSRLQKISEEYNIAVFVTNHIMSDMSLGNEPKPAGGHIMAHSTTRRILFTKLNDTKRLAKLCDSPDLAQNEAIFTLTSGGINDPID